MAPQALTLVGLGMFISIDAFGTKSGVSQNTTIVKGKRGLTTVMLVEMIPQTLGRRPGAVANCAGEPIIDIKAFNGIAAYSGGVMWGKRVIVFTFGIFLQDSLHLMLRHIG